MLAPAAERWRHPDMAAIRSFGEPVMPVIVCSRDYGLGRSECSMTSRPKSSKSSPSSRRPRRKPGSPSTGRPMRRVALAEVKDDLSRFLRLAESEEILITRHGKPAGVLIGFETEEDWVDYRLEHHPEFLRRVAEARKALDKGRGVRLEDVPS